MENASKALLMAGEILIGMLLLFLLAYFSNMAQNFTSQVDRNIEAKQIQEFNAKLEVYNNRNNLTPQDIITLSNVVKENNNAESYYTQMEISIIGVEARFRNKIQKGFTRRRSSRIYEIICTEER